MLEVQFSPQQVVRMGAAWDTYRSPYWSRSATRPSILPSGPTPTATPLPMPTPTPVPIASQGEVGSLGGTNQVRMLDNSTLTVTDASSYGPSPVPRMLQSKQSAVDGLLLRRGREHARHLHADRA